MKIFKNRTKILSISLILFASLVVFASSAAAATTVSIESVTVDENGVSSVPDVLPDVDDPNGVGAVDVKLSFDSNVVDVTGAENGDFDIPALNLDDELLGGYVIIGGAQMLNPGLTTADSPITIATVEFTAVGNPGDSCSLTIEITNMYNATPLADNDILADPVCGTFTIKPTVDPTADPTADPTEIPEFPIILIPVTAIIGLMFLISRRK